MIDIMMNINKEVSSQNLVNLEKQNYNLQFKGNNGSGNISISNTINNNFSININNIIKFRPTIFKILGKFDIQVDLFVYVFRGSYSEYTIINAGEVIETTSDNDNYIYHNFSLEILYH